MTPDTLIGPADVNTLVEYFGARPTPRERWAVGTEYEKIAVSAATFEPLSYEQPVGIRALLEHLRGEFNWQPVLERDRVIALERDGASITLEPGGQVEFSGVPLRHLWQTCDELVAHGQELASLSRSLGIAWLSIGVNPLHSLEQIPLMPKQRYAIMYDYLPTRGRLARRMMKQTCSVQANIDFSDEADGLAKMRVACGVGPLVTAIFANSPFLEGEPTGYKSFRARIWQEVDPARCCLPPGVLDEGYRFSDYARFVLDAPMFFVIRRGEYIPLGGVPFREYLRAGAHGLQPTYADWLLHTTTMFPDVRLKQHLELRMTDCVPPPYLCAIPALWKGLLYDEGARAAAWELVRDFTPGEHIELREAVARDALAARVGNREVLPLARELVAIAREGLQRQGESTDGCDFLAPASEIVATGKCPADHLIEAYERAGGGANGVLSAIALTRSFDECMRLAAAP